MQETLNSKKKGDVAFRHKDLKAAIECYTQVKVLLPDFGIAYFSDLSIVDNFSFPAQITSKMKKKK